jgi:hypothetical protein
MIPPFLHYYRHYDRVFVNTNTAEVISPFVGQVTPFMQVLLSYYKTLSKTRLPGIYPALAGGG